MANEIDCPYCQESMPARIDSTCCPNGHEFNFNYAGMIANALRELRKREQVYPGLVAKGTMRQSESEYLRALQAQTIAVRAFNATRDEFAEFLRQKRGAAPAPPPHHDPYNQKVNSRGTHTR